MEKQTPHNNTFVARLFGALLLFLVSVHTGYAQLSKSFYKTSILNDTLVASGNRDFLYNSVNITNLTNDTISLIINITPPQGWNMVTQKLVTVSMGPNGVTSVPIRLYPGSSRTAGWETVRIEYRLNEGLEKLTDTFRVRVKEFTKFKADLPLSNCVKMDYEKNIRFPIHVKNMGNTPNKYTVRFSNAFLNLDYKEEVTLQPAMDTTFYVPLHITERQWSVLKREDIKVTVTVENGETMNLTQVVSKIGSLLKDHGSAFLDMPLQLETGATYQGDNDIQYYGALHGTVDFTPQDHLGLDLRSKTLSKGQASTDNSIVRAEYSGLKWNATAGNINELTDFYMDGYGAKIGHVWKQRDKVDVFGLLQSRTGDSKLGGMNYLYGGLRENIKINGGLTANFDNERALNSYLVKQGGEWKFGENNKLTVNAGAGMEQTFAKLVNGANNTQWGTSVGYNLQMNNKWSGITSTVLMNSNSYPGIFKGQRMQSHDARLIYKSTFIGGYYDFNLRKQNIYQDTALFSNVFNLKTNNYGARTGISLHGANIIFSAGNQFQVQSDTGQFAKYKFSYLNLNLSLSFIKNFYFNVNSYYGQGAIPGQESTTSVPVNSNQGNIQYRWIGAAVRYDRGPYYYHEYTAYIKNPDKYERTILSPYLDISFFKTALNIRSQFNYSKNLPGNTETSNLLTNIVYTNFKYGFDFNILGITPIKQQGDAKPYISASLRVRLVAPFVAVRKYYVLKMVLFKDVNNNGEMEKGEEPIQGQGLAIKGNIFVTDKSGTVVFRNIEKGEYKTDFGKGGKIRGWIPSGGPVQTFLLKGNQTIYVPYKISKILQGKLSLEIDSNSSLTFKLANIKVTAQTIDKADTVEYSTLTEENGDFYFNLPAGHYNITLSPTAFDDVFRPTQFTQRADLENNDNKTLYFTIRQKKRTINIKKKE